MKIVELKSLQKPVKIGVSIPGSKSYTNRALFIAAISGSRVKITNPLISDDTRAMIDCLKTLGVNILERKDCIEVFGNLKNIPNRLYSLNARLSGITLRFLLALSTIIPGIKILSGEEGLNKRPIADLVSGLTQLGAKIEYLGKKGYPPVKILSSKLNPGFVKIKGSVSSQYISALLMIAPLIGEVNIEIAEKQISIPYIDMTIDIMEKFGVKVINKEYQAYVIAPQKYIAEQYTVEGDVSSACYFLATAALTKSTITIKNINPKSQQADMRFLKILEDMGNKIMYGRKGLTIVGEGIKPISVDMQSCPDQVQTLSVLAAFADGVSKISGVQSLRIKETDRVAALKQELKKMGIKTSATKNVLTVYGGNPQAARIDTYGDHRMAMSFAIAGAKLSEMEIVDPDVVNKTFPAFWEKFTSIGVKVKKINQQNVILIGMRGSGKTTVGKILAKKLKRDLIETDELVVEKSHLTIPEIVEKFGWDKFRQLETSVVKQVVNFDHQVISTGGGMVLRDRNRKLLKKNGIIFYLRCQIPTLVKRVGNDSNRPLLTTKKILKEELDEVLKQRKRLYQKVADEIIDTDNLDPNEVTNLVLAKLKGIKVCMVIGDPIKHSFSPQMHNVGYQALGIDNQFVYIAERVTKENLKSALVKAKILGVRGISVTIPHKQNVIKYLDEIDPTAKKIGAVNTIVNEGGKLTGFNTDWTGVLTALEKNTNVKGKKVALIGAGGVARAIVYGLVKKGAKLKIFNRSPDKSRQLAEDFSCEYGSLDSLGEVVKMDIVINSTSVGMNEEKSPIEKKFLNNRQIVFDVVYSPKETRLIKYAKEKGAQVVYGYEMLLYQGVAQFELYTGLRVPMVVMRKVLEETLK